MLTALDNDPENDASDAASILSVQAPSAISTSPQASTRNVQPTALSSSSTGTSTGPPGSMLPPHFKKLNERLTEKRLKQLSGEGDQSDALDSPT
jgi:hypothetical protein